MTLETTQLLETPQPHRFTRDEYYELAELGSFQNRRVELIDGEIIDMPAMKDLHAIAIGQAQKSLLRVFADCWVRCQLPMSFMKDSEPGPDFSVASGAPRDYIGKGHPQAALLLLEIADTSLRFDRGKKASVYARAGIADYWIVNLMDHQVEVMRDPVADAAAPLGWRYQSITIAKPNETISPLARPECGIAVADLLP